MIRISRDSTNLIEFVLNKLDFLKSESKEINSVVESLKGRKNFIFEGFFNKRRVCLDITHQQIFYKVSIIAYLFVENCLTLKIRTSDDSQYKSILKIDESCNDGIKLKDNLLIRRAERTSKEERILIELLKGSHYEDILTERESGCQKSSEKKEPF